MVYVTCDEQKTNNAYAHNMKMWNWLAQQCETENQNNGIHHESQCETEDGTMVQACDVARETMWWGKQNNAYACMYNVKSLFATMWYNEFCKI